MKKLLDLYDRIKREEDIQKRHEYVRLAVRIHIDEGPFQLGTAARIPALVVIADNFHDVPRRESSGPGRSPGRRVGRRAGG